MSKIVNDLVADLVFSDKTNIEEVKTTDIIITNIQQVDNISANNLIADHTFITSSTYSNLDVSNTLIATTINATGINSETFEIENYSADSLTVPTINIEQLVIPSHSQTITNTTVLNSEETFFTNATGDNLSANYLNANSIDNSQTDSLFLINNNGQPIPTSDSGVTLRGPFGSTEIHFGLGEYPNVKESLQLTLNGVIPQIIGYNLTLDDFDSGTTIGGTGAIFSMSSTDSPYRTLRFQEDGNLAIYSGTATQLWSSGTEVSDVRLKENITKISDSIDKIMNIVPCRFEYISDIAEGPQVGVSAQNLLQIFPECVPPLQGDYYRVEMEKIVPLLIEGIKDLNSRTEKLSCQINDFSSKNL